MSTGVIEYKYIARSVSSSAFPSSPKLPGVKKKMADRCSYKIKFKMDSRRPNTDRKRFDMHGPKFDVAFLE
jgi:hypothetical protein